MSRQVFATVGLLALVAYASRSIASETPAEKLRVASDFEGGSVQVLSIDQAQRVIRFTPGGDPERGWPCWWSFRIDGSREGETITLDLKGSPLSARNNGKETGKPLASSWAMPAQAAISSDGVAWRQTKPGTLQDGAMRYEISGTGQPIHVAWGPPFTPKDTERLIADAHARLPAASGFELATTRQGRPVRGLHIMATKNPNSPCVWIQARQHAWESGASWVGRGVTEWLVSDADAARVLRSEAEIFIVPIMDVDNVATGNGGKEANPRDHNRDWDSAPVYPEVAAAQARLQKLAGEGRLSLFIDLHNPAPGDKRPFFFVGPPELLSLAGRERRERFIQIAARNINDPLALLEAPRVTGPTYHPLWKQISGQWVNANGNPETVSVCLETSWNTPHSTTDGYRTVGNQLAKSVAELMADVAVSPAN
ncbi:M14-type cytosolic carboxypeptidase [Caulifigura coniformis]|nr:M14-type cytosolic carboxypeptidase [Caulifigura coniformis]